MPPGVHAVAAAFLLLAAGYALATPPWNNPDEPAHFNYIGDLADRMQLPVLEAGDWDAPRLEALKAAKFADPADIAGIDYEAHQPPLYYGLAATLHRVTITLPLREQVLVLRGFSIALGLILIYLTAYLALQVRPEDWAVATLAAAFVAFLPMHTAMSAAINNDALANLLGAALLTMGTVALNRGLGRPGVLLLGGLVGAAVLTKTTLYVLIPIVLAAVAMAWPRQRFTLPAVAAAGALAVMVSGWWLVRNGSTYGWTDPLAAARHDEVVVGQLRTADAGPEVALGMLTTLRNSFWGDFGWMGIPLHDPIYQAYQVLLVLGLLGSGFALLGAKREDRSFKLGIASPDPFMASLVLLVVSMLAVGFALLGYNLKFVQPQGRYLFPALAAISVLISLGITALVRGDHLPAALRWLGISLVVLAAGAVAIESASALAPDLPRRVLYFLAIAAAGLGPALDRYRPQWREPFGVAALSVALGWADLALLLGVVGPAFR